MRILGIDPGYAIVGWGVLRAEGGRFVPLASGAIETRAGVPFDARLEQIYTQIGEGLTRWKPQAAAVEKLYFSKNKTTAIGVAHARGVLLLACRQAKCPIYEYTPMQVKQAVTGYGGAKKPQVMEMTRRLLHLKEVPRPDDTADALALAITHAQASASVLRREALGVYRLPTRF